MSDVMEEKRTYYYLPCDQYGQPRGDVWEILLTPAEAAKRAWVYEDYATAVRRAMD